MWALVVPDFDIGGLDCIFLLRDENIMLFMFQLLSKKSMPAICEGIKDGRIFE